MMSGKGMPPEIRALLKKIGVVGVEEEAMKLCPYVVQLDSDDEDPGETVSEAAEQAAR
jgi:hypothetical protein